MLLPTSNLSLGTDRRLLNPPIPTPTCRYLLSFEAQPPSRTDLASFADKDPLAKSGQCWAVRQIAGRKNYVYALFVPRWP